MQQENIGSSKEIQQLVETNEALLKSKGRLQNEIIELKKNIADQGKNIKLIEELQLKIGILNYNLADQTSRNTLISAENGNLSKEIDLLTSKIEYLENENHRLQQLSWFKKLIGKK